MHQQEIQPTILIVDDNSINVKIIAITLRKFNYNIIIAEDGEEAIRLMNEISPDLILLDVMMPKMNGFEVCRIIKSEEKNKNIPIIFITALNDPESLVEAFKSGGIDYIKKPFNKDELISRVTTHVSLKFTQDKLRHTTEHLEKLNSLKDKMFSVIGHDLRSPLGSVKTTLEFLSKTVNNPEDPTSQHINIMLKSTDEAFRLLENLLNWAKSQSGNLNIIPENVNITDLVDNVFFLNKANIEQKQIQFKIDVKKEHTIWADLNTMQVVFRNIVSNAIKFTPEKGKICIVSELKGDKMLIKIRDNGIGISKEALPKIFSQMEHYTTFGTNKEKGSGLGVGLSIDFVEKNNGKIWVESEEGKGTCFFIEIPSNQPTTD